VIQADSIKHGEITHRKRNIKTTWKKNRNHKSVLFNLQLPETFWAGLSSPRASHPLSAFLALALTLL